MLVSQFLKLPEAEKQLQAFAKEHNSPLVVLVGIEVSGDTVKRDIALFGVNCNDLVRLLEEALLNCECSNGETLGVVWRDLADFVVYFEQMNVKASRKQVVPVVKEVMMRYKEGCCS